jgi:hypothetical protein
MLLDYHNNLLNHRLSPATRLVVYDNMNNPIAVFIENDKNIIVCATAGDDDFLKVLEDHGLDKPVIRKINL